MTTWGSRALVPPGRQSTAAAGYSPGVLLGGVRELIFVAGHVGLDDADAAIADPEDQFTALFERAASVLATAEASYDDVVDMTSYHVSFDTIETFMKVKARYLTGAVAPAWTAVGVSALGVPGALVEVKFIAAIGGASVG